MNEVSCKVFEILTTPLEERGVSIEQMVAGTSVSVARLRDKKERISWSDYVAIMRNVRPYFTDDEYVELGRSYMRSPGVRFVFVIARLLFAPIDLYRWFSKPRAGVGNQMFSCIVPSHREISPSEVQLELTLAEGYEMCWDFFLISSGNMEELPRLFGQPRAKLKLTRLPRGAHMDIALQPYRPLVGKVWRVLSWPFTARAAARELQDAHETLVERYEQLEDARAKLARQATQLRTAHTVNEMVQADLDLARTLATIAMALVDEAGFTWAEIRIDEGAQRASFGSAEHGEPVVRTLKARGGDVIGELAVAPKRDADLREREELLAFILPSMAMAVENAIYRTNLERLVDERTTELRHARDELAGTVDQLRKAQGARERFFGNISHEIRTPLTIIMLAASDVAHRSGKLLDARGRANLSAVNDAARKLVRLVDELLLLAAGQEGKLRTAPEPTDLAELIRHLASAWQTAAEAAGLTLMVRVPPALVANVDPVAMERIGSNLISNAVKYTPRGGHVDIELALRDDGIVFAVLDTGPGIGEELAGRLFGRFERSNTDTRRKQGVGLGLSLVKQLVEAHEGTILALTRPTGGAELRVELPLQLVIRDAVERVTTQLRLVDPMLTATRGPSQLVPEGASRGTIVLAEDDSRLAEQVARLLAEEYTVLIANDGVSALELVQRHQPQLLITDVDMPGLDGLELSRRFREITGDRLAPIIILSAMLDLGTRVAGLDAGATDYVTKPFDPLELRARVQAQLRMRDLAVRLHRAEQLSTLGILTSGLAHELRNPANAIVNAITPLEQTLPAELRHPNHAAAQLIGVVRECADQIGFLSRQLLGFRGPTTELAVRGVAMRELVQRALSLAHRALTGIEVRIEVPAEATITCAPPLFVQALTNLFENAGHAAGRGGWIEVRGTVGDTGWTIEVSDSGPGVPRELRDRVFEPFFTTKANVGTGLGLPLARDIVHRHRGALEIRDRGPGSVFVIELPQDFAGRLTADAV